MKQKKDMDTVFLDTLAESGSVTAAAERAGLARRALYRRRAEDDGFALAWSEAETLGLAALEDEARRRALEGRLEQVWHKGEPCGTVRKFSDALLVLLLKAHMPEKYGLRARAEGAVRPADPGAPGSPDSPGAPAVVISYRIPDNGRDQGQQP